MKLIIDENIPLADGFFADLGELVKKPGRLLTRDDVKDADVLLVRSVTQVNEALLQDTPVKFVGSATIGEDHIDVDYLRAQGIGFASAPGCNAVAVVEYVAAALLDLEERLGWSMQGKTLGIVGLGNVGSRIKPVFEALGLSVLACDPLLAEQGHSGLVSLDEVLQADIVTLHTPLTRSGAWPTYHMLGSEQLRALPEGAILINASRGPVIDNLALRTVLADRGDLSVVLDVWEGEPLVDPELAQRVEIATPHIAGHSFDGKARGTAMIYEALCRFLQRSATKSLDDLIPESALHLIDLNEAEEITNCRDLVRKVYRIEEDDVNLRSALQHAREHRIAAFDQLRKHYRLRREFSAVELRGVESFMARIDPQEIARMRALGFCLP